MDQVLKIVGKDTRWIVAQTVLFTAALVTPVAEFFIGGRGFTLWAWPVNVIAGSCLIAGSVYVASHARSDLSTNLSISPTPVEDGYLVDSGVYRVVRHPMYTSAIMGIAGWAIIWGSWIGITLTLIAVAYFGLKTQHEEVQLRDQYPGYREYSSRVRARFIPKIF